MSVGVGNTVRVVYQFDSSRQHIDALLGWLHRLLAWQASLTRHINGALADDPYRGLYIPEAEVDLLSNTSVAIPLDLWEQRRALNIERTQIAADALAAERSGVRLLLHHLTQLFDLSQFEEDVLCLAFATEIDLRYERMLGFIQDDITKKRPTVDLALRLLCSDPRDLIVARAAFAPDAPLRRYHLIQLCEDGQRQPGLLAHSIKLDDRIVTELLGQSAIDPQLVPFISYLQPTRALHDMVLPTELIARLNETIARHSDGLVLALHGSYGSGRRALAKALCAHAGVALLTVDLDRLCESSLNPTESARRIVREAALQAAAVFWHGIDRLLHKPEQSDWRFAILKALDEYQGYSFLALDQLWEAGNLIRRNTFLRIELPSLSYTERERLWQQRLNGDTLDTSILQGLASTFRLSGGQIRDAVKMARTLAHWQSKPISASDLYAACRAQSSGKLDNLAHKITTTYSWDDIVLPSDQVGMLREVCAQVRHRSTVLERWGFDHHLAMGKGVNVLFAGPSGTGKTMAAEIIAADLGLELYRVDLSMMVSKYIGETEKNLDRIFTAAREANAILFFDEADALFGKRSEVKDAHDRYANIEVGYLLQKMEAYDGIVILATNLRKNLDDAFARRLHVAIDFQFPEEPDRLRIWQKVFPPEAPLAADVDRAFLARQFKLAGGNIRNIALLAAYLAAEEGNSIGMSHLIRAIKREYQKLGKLVTEAEFGSYLTLVRR